MCVDCWVDRGRPRIDSAPIRNAARLVEELFAARPTGGFLHIVVDDWNVEESMLDFCEREMRDAVAGYKDYPQADCVEEYRALHALRVLPENLRTSALALAAGYWGPGEKLQRTP